MTTWADDTFDNINSGGNYWTAGGFGTDTWVAVTSPATGIRENYGFAHVMSTRIGAPATGADQYVKMLTPDASVGGFVMGLRCPDGAPPLDFGGGYVARTQSGTVFWYKDNVNVGTAGPGTPAPGPGTWEMRCVSNVCTIYLNSSVYSTWDFSSAPVTSSDDNNQLIGSAYGQVITYAEGGDIGGAATVPDQVTGLLTHVVTSHRVDLGWNAPASNGGAPISGYKVSRAPDVSGSPGTWTVLTANTGIPSPRVYQDLTTSAGQHLWYRVSALNSVGEGATSTPVDALPVDPPPPAFTEDFSKGLRMWTIARWRSQGSGNPGAVPPSSNDDGHYDGVLGNHTSPNGPGLLPPYDIFVGTNNWLYVGGGMQNYGDTFLRCAQKMDMSGAGPWVIRLGFVPNINWHQNAPGLLGWTTLYCTDKPMASPSMRGENSDGPVPQSGWAVRLDGANVSDGTNTHPAPMAFTYNSYVESSYIVDSGHSIYDIPTDVSVETVLTFTRSSLRITADGQMWFDMPWTLPTALTSGWLYLGAHNHAERKYGPHNDSRSAIFTHFEFDGPTIPPQYSYSVPDSLTPCSPEDHDEQINVGWGSGAAIPTLTLPNVPANVSSAQLVMSTKWTPNFPDSTAYRVRYSLNGNATHDIATDYINGSGNFSFAANVNPTELITGNNALNLQLLGQVGGNLPFVGNISLLVEAFSTGKIAVGSTILTTLNTGGTAIKALAVGGTEVWRAPLPPQVPTYPTVITVLSGSSTSLNVRWSLPVDNGAALTDYTVQYRVSPSGTWTTFAHTVQTTRSITVTGLASGTVYDIRVAAVNSLGTGPWSNVMTQPGPLTAPGVPSIVAMEPGDQLVRVIWSNPPTGGSAITDYVNEYRTNPSGTWTTFSHAPSPATDRIITGLTNNIPYDFRVSSINAIGTSVPSAVATSTPVGAGPTVPGAPTLDTATSGNTTVALAWTATSTGGSVITDYLIEKSPNGTSSWTTVTDGVSTATSYTVTGLTNGTIQYFRVSAINSVGTGAVSNVLSATPATVAVSLAGSSTGVAAASAALVVTGFPVLATQNNEVGTTMGAQVINMPTGITAGDLLIAIAALDMAAAAGTLVASAGWTEIRTQTQGSTVIRLSAFAKIAAGSDTLTITGTSQDYCAWTGRFTGHGVDAVTNIPVTDATGATGNADPPNLNPAIARQWMWLVAEAVDLTTSSVITSVPSGYTSQFNNVSASSTSSVALAVGTKTANTTSEDPGVFTNNPTTRPWVAFTIGIPHDPPRVVALAGTAVGASSSTATLTSTGGAVAALYADDFNRADAGSLGSPWVIVDGGTLAIASNKAAATGSETGVFAKYNQTFTADQWAECDVTVYPGVGNGNSMGPAVRFGAANGGVYYVNYDKAADGLNVWCRDNGGGFTQVGTGSASTAGLGGVFKVRIEAQGSTIRMYLNGTQVLSTSNTSVASGQPGLVGARYGTVPSPPLADNFRCGDLPYTPLFSSLYSDDFNRANGALAAPWVVTLGGLAISSNKAVSTGSAPNVAKYNRTFSADQWSEADVTHSGSTIESICPCVRVSSGGDFYYLWTANTVNVMEIWKGGTAGYHQVGTTATTPTSFKARLEAQGTTIRAYINGTLAITGTDPDVASGQPGILGSNVSGATLDNWRGGDLPYTPVFLPTDLTGLKAWYDANDTASFTYHSGVLVSQWSDKSGASMHMLQATSGNAPSRNVTAPSGKTAVRFASKWMLTNAITDVVSGNALTFAFVVKRDTASTGPSSRIVVGYDNGSPDYAVTGAMLYDTPAGCPAMYRDPSSQVTSSPSMAVGTWGVVLGVWDGTNFNFYVNGVNTGTVATTGNFSIDIFALGVNSSGGELGDNTLGEVAIYNRALNATERSSVTSYLTGKWL